VFIVVDFVIDSVRKLLDTPFENRALGRIFRPKREEVAGGWRRLRNEELPNLYSSPNIRAIKSRSMRWEGDAAHMGERWNA
jgi:hypothetical protein